MILHAIRRRSTVFFLLLLLSSGCAGAPVRQAEPPGKISAETLADESGGIRWVRYFEALGDASKDPERILLVHFTTDSCEPCEMMQKWTFTDKRVQRAMKDFVPVKVRGDVEIQAARRFGMQSFPTTMFYDPKEGEIDRKSGFRSADFLLEGLAEVKENQTTLSALGKRLKENPDDLAALVGQARNLVDADRVEQAFELARRAQALAPENPDVLAIIGLCNLRTGRIEEAETAIDASLEMDEKNEMARRLKIAILLIRADTQLMNDHAEAAMENYSAVLGIEPENFDGLIGTGRALLKLGRGPDALEEFRRAAGLRPASPIPHNAIGNYYKEAGDHAEAERAFLSAIDIEPRHEPPYFRLIELYEEQGERDKMMAMYEKALALSPAGAHNEIAWLMATSKHPHILDPEKAMEHAGTAIELDPRPWYIDTLAEAYYAAGKYGPAIAIIKEAIAKEPDDLQYYHDQLKKFQDAKDEAALEEKGEE